MAFVPDFTSYFAFPRGQLQTSGFNGVATFCRESAGVRPSHAEVTLFLDAGRTTPGLKGNTFNCAFIKFWKSAHYNFSNYNTTHQSIDVYDDDQWCYKDSCSRKWLSELLSKKQDDSSDQFLFFDAFRHLNPNEEKSFTCWNVKLDCRKTNFGSRLDYIVIDHKLLPHLTKCTPLSDFLGSDHCPVVAEFR
ncbi:DNA-(apurinic or apyrimidinic site) lyase 2 [Tyrophagus putrescentiae]|nr:DNA-(apurinic or apyrimidinic site) lyase 2 [Tyrophagus putrescentiae]